MAPRVYGGRASVPRAVVLTVANKSPAPAGNKKQGKSLMEKRAVKKAKKAEKSKRGTTA